MSLRTQKTSRLLEYVTTGHLAFGSTMYVCLSQKTQNVCVCVVPGADNSDKGLINIHLQIHPSSSGAYTAQRRVRSSQRLKETHKNEGEEEAKSSRGYLNPHKCSINTATTAAQQGPPPRCYRYASTSTWRAPLKEPGRSKSSKRSNTVQILKNGLFKCKERLDRSVFCCGW